MTKFFAAVGYVVSVLAAAFGVVYLINRLTGCEIEEELECECEDCCDEQCDCAAEEKAEEEAAPAPAEA